LTCIKAPALRPGNDLAGNTHPSVLEAAVVPARDANGLIKPKAFIVLKEGGGSELSRALYEDIKLHVKRTIGPWKYPRWIEIVDSLPKTATGKIQRFKLRSATPEPLARPQTRPEPSRARRNTAVLA
jgi:acyl-coenzyme A synthetase/AMP-(fatty) acid ligase